MTNKSLIMFLLNLVCVAFGLSTMAQEDSSIYNLAYLDVDISRMNIAEEQLRSRAETARSAPGNLHFSTFQNIHRPNQFLVLEHWANNSASEAFSSRGEAKTMREAMIPILTAGYAELGHIALDVNKNDYSGDIVLVTHVDIMPPQREHGTKLLLEAAEKIREAKGNTSFNLIVQPNRRNHITIVESWVSLDAYLFHTETETFKRYRHAIQPIMGSLYDERLYRTIK